MAKFPNSGAENLCANLVHVSELMTIDQSVLQALGGNRLKGKPICEPRKVQPLVTARCRYDGGDARYSSLHVPSVKTL